MLRILSFSSSLPSSKDPNSGIFVLRRLCALAKHAGLEAVHPVARFPLYKGSSPCPSREREKIQGLTVHHREYFYFPRVLKRLDGWFYYWGLVGWLRKHFEASGKPDLLDAHFAWPDGVGVSYLARCLNLPYTVTLRGTINPRYEIPCFRRRMSDALQNASAVISVSKAMANIAAELGAGPRRIYVIPNGVDTSLFSPTPKIAARKQLGLPENAPLIVCVASLKPPKGHRDLIDAASRLAENVHLVIIGAETDRGAYLRHLEALVGEKRLTDRVTFAGSQHYSKMPLYFSAADVSALASHNEGCPNVLLESLACGTPVVATSVGGVPDIVQPGETGELVPVGAPAALADALRTALAKRWSRDHVRQSVSGRSWGCVGEQVLEVFRAVIEGHA